MQLHMAGWLHRAFVPVHRAGAAEVAGEDEGAGEQDIPMASAQTTAARAGPEAGLTTVAAAGSKVRELQVDLYHDCETSALHNILSKLRDRSSHRSSAC